MKRDLFLAILSMDSYNRGYGVHLTGLELGNNNQAGNFVGNLLGDARIKTDSQLKLQGSAASGFYAIAYTAGAGIEGIAAGQSAG
jgi:hypothetical protein